MARGKGKGERTVSVLGNLLRKEIMRNQLNPLGHLGIRTQRLRRAVNRLLQVLHHKPHVLVPLRQINTDKPMRPPNINKRAPLLIQLPEIIPPLLHIHKERRLVALAAGQARHGATHAPRAHGVLAKGREHGLLIHGIKRELEAGAGERRRLGVGVQSLQDVAGRGEDVLSVEADPGLHVLVLGEDAGRGRVRDDARGGLAEDAVGHGHAEDAGEVDGVEGGEGCEGGQGDGGGEGDEFRWGMSEGGGEGGVEGGLTQAVVVDRGEGEDVEELRWGSVSRHHTKNTYSRSTHLPNPPPHRLPRPMRQQPQLLGRMNNIQPALLHILGQRREIRRSIDIKVRHGQTVGLHVRLELLSRSRDPLGQLYHPGGRGGRLLLGSRGSSSRLLGRAVGLAILVGAERGGQRRERAAVGLLRVRVDAARRRGGARVEEGAEPDFAHLDGGDGAVLGMSGKEEERTEVLRLNGRLVQRRRC